MLSFLRLNQQDPPFVKSPGGLAHGTENDKLSKPEGLPECFARYRSRYVHNLECNGCSQSISPTRQNTSHPCFAFYVVVK